MFKNIQSKKGFTLVELLSTLAILAIVLGIVSTAYIGISKHLRASYYKTLEESILVSGGEYYSYSKERPEMFADEKRVSLRDLVTNKYSTDITDRKGNQCDLDSSYVGAYKDSYDKTNYYVCLKCDDYQSTKPECLGNIDYSLQMIATVNDTNKVYQVNNWVNKHVKLSFRTLNNVKTVYVIDPITSTNFACTMSGTSIKTCNIKVDKTGNYDYYGVSDNGQKTKQGHIDILVDTTAPTFEVYENTVKITSGDIIIKNITSNTISINDTVKNIVDLDSKVQSIRYSFEKQGSSKNYVAIDNNLTEFDITKNLGLGEYDLIIEIKDYAGNITTKKITYQINKIIDKPDNSYCNDLTYNGYEQTLTKVPGEGYTFTNNKATNAGNYEVTANLNDYYLFSDDSPDAKFTCTIAKKPVEVNWGNTVFTYNGSPQAPTATASSGVSGETLNIIRTTGTNAGSYTSTASISSVTGGRADKNNYILTGNTKAFIINKANPSVTLSATSGSVNAGSSITFTEKASISGSFSNTSGTTSVATVSPASYSNIAANTTKTVTITGVSNGTSTITIVFTPTDTNNYNLRTLTYTVTGYLVAYTGSCQSRTYNGSSQTLASGGTGVNYSNNTRTDYGTQTVTVSLKSGYRWSNATTANRYLSCSIAKKSVEVSWGSTTVFTYNGSPQAPTATASSGVSGETLNIIRTTGTNAGNYTSTASISSVTGGRASENNYILTGNTKAFTINKATPSVTLSATSGSVNAGSSITFTEKANISGSFSNTSGTTSVATVRPASYSNIAANTTKTVTITGVSNGTSTITIIFTPTDTNNYNARTLTYTVTGYRVAYTGSCQSRTYNGSSQTLASGGTGVSYSNNTKTYYGSQTVTVSLKSGYRWSNATTGNRYLSCSISKKSVTITAKNQTITDGGSIATGTGYITSAGLISGHSITDITLTQSTTNGTITPSGAVIKSGATDVTSNYSISYQNGSLIISQPSPPSVSISISGTTYSDGYKSPATATVSCESSDGISSFTAKDNTGDTGSWSTNTSTKKVKKITLSSASSSRKVSVSCTSTNGLSASTSKTVKIYVYSASSACGVSSYSYSGTCTCKVVGMGQITKSCNSSVYFSGGCSSWCKTQANGSPTEINSGSCSRTTNYKSCYHT